MSRRTGKEIAEEIDALRALVPVGPFAEKTKRHIADAIDELQSPYDRSCGEWEELSDAEQDTRTQIEGWVEGLIEERYSDRKSWGNLVQ